MATHPRVGSRSEDTGNVSRRHFNKLSKVTEYSPSPVGCLCYPNSTSETAASLALMDTKRIHCDLHYSFDLLAILGADPNTVHTARTTGEWSCIYRPRPSWQRKRHDCTSRHQGRRHQYMEPDTNTFYNQRGELLVREKPLILVPQQSKAVVR